MCLGVTCTLKFEIVPRSHASPNDIKLNDRKLFIRFFLFFVSLLYAFFALIMLAYYVIQVLFYKNIHLALGL